MLALIKFGQIWRRLAYFRLGLDYRILELASISLDPSMSLDPETCLRRVFQLIFIFFTLNPAHCLRGARGRKGWPLVSLTFIGFHSVSLNFN